MTQLVVIFWNQDEPTTKAATTIHLFESEPKPENLGRQDGMSIAEFFKSRNISINQYMEMFPGKVGVEKKVARDIAEWISETGSHHGAKWVAEHIFHRKDWEEPSSWDSPLRWQELPNNEENMRRLAHLINMPISVFFYFRHRDEVPQLQYRVKPS